MRSWILILSLAWVGCTQRAVLELPPFGDEVEYIALLTLDDNGNETGGTGLLRPDESIDLELNEESTRFLVVAYDEGVLEPIDEQTRMQRVHVAEPSSPLLPPASRSWEKGSEGSWRERDPIGLTAAWLPPLPCSDQGRAEGLCPCRRFVTSWTTRVPGPIDRARVALVDGVVYTFAHPTREAQPWTWALPLTEGSTGTTLDPGVYPGSLISSHWVGPDGAIWLGGDIVARWDRFSRAAEVVHWPLGTVFGIEGAPQGAPAEVYLSERYARVERFDGSTWELIYDNAADEPAANQSGRVGWVAPGRAVAALHSQRNLLFYEHGEPPVLERRSEVLNAVEVLTFNATMGLLWGSATGQVAQLVGDRFEPLPRVDDAPLTGLIESLEDYPGGAVYATRNGWLGQVHEAVGVCVPQPLTGYSKVMGAVVHNEQIVIVGRATDGSVRADVLRPE